MRIKYKIELVDSNNTILQSAGGEVKYDSCIWDLLVTIVKLLIKRE